ncbi:MAG: class E sortase [Acidimicrobiales bacterium]
MGQPYLVGVEAPGFARGDTVIPSVEMFGRGAVRVLGRILVGCGVLVLLFAAYQLFGTDLPAARSQQALRHQFSTELKGHAQATPRPGATSRPSPAPDITAPPDGSALGVIYIPRINVDKVIVQGIGEADLQKGPGHYPGTPLPGERGNAAIAGHRTTYGAPFYRLDGLRKSDPITITTIQGTFTYRVIRSFVVAPTDLAVIAPTRANMLTLTTCNPRYSAAQRLIVQAVLVGNPAPGALAATPQATARNPNRPSWVPALLWGLALIALGALVWWLGRRLGSRRWAAYVGGTPVALVLLYVFFSSVSVLLPVTL